MKFVLSLPGGGIFGYRSVRALIHLEHMTKKPTGQMFDLVGGTSTGSLITSAVCSGYSADEIELMYLEDGPRIFGKPRPVLNQSKHVISVLNSVIRQRVGNGPLSELQPKAMILSAGLSPVRTVVFKSWTHGHVKTWKAVASSCSAPTYFDHVNVDCEYPENVPDGKPGRMVDGGVWAADPSISLYTEARRLWPSEPICVLKIGTGNKSWRIKRNTLGGQGLIHWGPSIIPFILDLQNQASDYYMNRILRPEDVWLNFDVQVTRDTGMDDASGRNFNLMKTETQEAILQHRELFNTFHKMIT